jgi:D-alanine-D-alanine ligase
LIFGGRSVEHEVSVSSARGVRAALRDAGFVDVPLAVTGEGRWLSPELSGKLLDSERPRAEPLPSEEDGRAVAFCPGLGPLSLVGPAGESRPLRIDVVFPLIHGWGGEDGRLQGLLELADLPYVGCGVAASALAMDKIFARTVLDARGIPGVRWLGFDRQSLEAGLRAVESRVARQLGYPVFVKPANGGSSVGITRVASGDGLEGALQRALECDRRVIVEVAVGQAREIECAVLGNERPEAAALGEVIPSNEFYDYEAKYIDDESQLVIPANLESSRVEDIRGLALRAYRELDLAGFARVDFLIEPATGGLFLNEINTLPGFTTISMFPKMWAESGLTYGRLVERLVELALERKKSDAFRRFRWEDDGSGDAVGKDG